MFKNNKVTVLFSMILIALSSCGGITTDGEGGGSEAVNILNDEATLKKAQEELSNLPAYKGKDVRFFQSIHFHGGKYPKIVIELVNPDNGEDVDHFEYQNGSWGTPQPVQISGGGGKEAMLSNSKPLKEVDFSVAAKCAKAWDEKAKEVKGTEKCDHIFLYFWRGTWSWDAGTIETARAEYNINFKDDGSVKEFEKR